ncbi:MAG: hypothetical protein K8J31_01425 [Anaerolineae bacterium]|nr:hypothetical protein [Anaerolineae bacterium]
MTIKSILPGLIGTAALIYTLTFAAAQEYLIALLAFALGFIWLLLEIKRLKPPATLFFLFFVGLAIIGCVQDGPVLLMLLGLSSTLAAWDLSRFQSRATLDGEIEMTAGFEERHLRRLAIVAGAGFLLALLPLLATLPMNFVVLAVVLLVTMSVLRRAFLTLRQTTPEEVD